MLAKPAVVRSVPPQVNDLCVTALLEGQSELQQQRVALCGNPMRWQQRLALLLTRLPLHGPDGVDVAKAAGLPVAFGTAHLALLERAKLQANQSLLVLGAGGGVGVAAVQVWPGPLT